ncbi:MAG: hypothetical protein LBU32_00750 [Clostridiales bacterium]|nr:hypothetical protein [Clostridiales bacterium]
MSRLNLACLQSSITAVDPKKLDILRILPLIEFSPPKRNMIPLRPGWALQVKNAGKIRSAPEIDSFIRNCSDN